jgi:cobalt/nickel transport system permease protein
MCAVSASAIAYSVSKIKKDELCEKKIPVMGVMGAFIFAAQMINFTIPATGSSGHIGGGVLLAAMIGGFPAFLSITAVLIIQCLFFADGGLLALGCNIFNMGLLPCLIVYPLVFKPVVKKKMTTGNITLASIAAVVIGLQLGAFCVVLETLFSGITGLPFTAFVFLMQPIHLAIGVIEGIITAAVLCFVYKTRPEIIESAFDSAAVKSPVKNIIITLAVLTLFTGGVLAMFASSYPDGLEWSVEKTAGAAEFEAKGALMEGAARVQNAAAFMPDYNFKNAVNDSERAGVSKGDLSPKAGISVAGIIGSLLTFLLAGITAFTIFTVKNKLRKKALSHYNGDASGT